MYRLNANTFIGTDAERTGNNFDIGSYFIDGTTGYQYVMLFTGNWLQLVSSGGLASVPDPLTIGALVVTGTATLVGNDVASFGNGAAVSLPNVALHLPLTAQNNVADLNGGLGQSPSTETGSIVGFDGGAHGNGSASFTDAFTNYATNPAFEVLDAFGGGMAATLSSLYTKHGSGSVECVTSANNQYYHPEITGLTNGEIYTVSFWVYLDYGSVQVSLYDAGTYNNAVVILNTTTTGWHKITEQRTVAGGGIRIWLRDGSVDVARFYATALQVTHTSYELPFRFYGMNGVTGSAGAVSVVDVSVLEYDSDVLSADAGTIMAWVNLSFNDSTQRYIARHFGGGGALSYFFIATSSGSAFRVRVGNAPVDRGAIITDSWQHVALTWDNGTAAFYVDGVLAGSTWSYSGELVGSNPLAIFAAETGTQHAAGEMCQLLVTKYAVAASTIKRIHDSGVPVTVPTATHELSAAGASGTLVINEDGLVSTLPMTLNGQPVATTDMITAGGSSITTQQTPATHTSWDGSVTIATGNYNIDLSTFTNMPAVSVLTPSEWIIFIESVSQGSVSQLSVTDSSYTQKYVTLKSQPISNPQSTMLFIPNTGGHIYLDLITDTASVKITINGYVI